MLSLLEVPSIDHLFASFFVWLMICHIFCSHIFHFHFFVMQLMINIEVFLEMSEKEYWY